MDKNAIKKYAVWARRELISRVSQKALQYGISDKEIVPAAATSVNGVVLSAEEIKQRKALIDRINSRGYEQVMEEVAYTWFNRFIALRFMEVNGYLPSRVRVFTDENNAFNPQILAEAINLELDGLDMDRVYALKDVNDNDSLFKYLIIIQCNALNPILPRMFQCIADYTELLFPDNLLREGSVIEQMIARISQDDWKDAVQIIGWLYQYYNDEKKDEVINLNRGSIKKEDIPAATQLFTTDWIVKYIVDNSLGRYWIEHNPNSCLKNELKYLIVPEVNNDASVVMIAPQEITVFDPCMGSAHFLAYTFDVLLLIYTEYGYSEREAVKEIVENNLYGLDVDDRAAQLAYFAVMMKGRQYDRRFFSRGVEPHIYAISESNSISKETVKYFANGNATIEKSVNSIISCLHNAKEYGSLIVMPEIDYSSLHKRLEELANEVSFYADEARNCLVPLIQTAELFSRQYTIVVTNPPYLNKYNDHLKKFLITNYKDFCGDLFSAFIVRNLEYCVPNGYCGYMTPYVWMFIQTYEKLRYFLLREKTIATLIQLEYSAFEEATVPLCTFVIGNNPSCGPGTYIKLSEFKGGMNIQEQKVLSAIQNQTCDYLYSSYQEKYLKIAGNPIAFWVSNQVADAFMGKTVGDIAFAKAGIVTGDDNTFLRLWYELNVHEIVFTAQSYEYCEKLRWVPMNKGGSYRKYYGNYEYVMDIYSLWTDGKTNKSVRRGDTDTYFKEAITWSMVTSSKASFRYSSNKVFGVAAPAIFLPKMDWSLLGYLNSKVVEYFNSFLNPTINILTGNILSLPYKPGTPRIDSLVLDNIKIEKEDWDTKETSWDFEVNPLIPDQSNSGNLGRTSHLLAKCFAVWESQCLYRLSTLISNEQEINSYYIQSLGLQSNVTPDVDVKDITVRMADKKQDIKNLISYAVGCMFGRYSLDVPGLVYAGGNIDEVYQKDVLGDGHGNAITFGGVRIGASNAYTRVKAGDDWVDCTIPVDADNIIPICDDEYFADDIVSRFIRFIETVYGKDTLQENLRFIADALGGSGQPKDVIRNYFLNDFYADHLKIYQKRPIYWLFDSGKKGGFRALIYMHRYQPDTIARMRTDYVHEQQARYRTAIADLEQRIASASTSERVKLSKRLKTLQEQATEIQAYEEKIHHLADQYIAIDLDDGVKKNYEIFKDVLAKIK